MSNDDAEHVGSSTHTLITALRALAREIQSADGVANAAIAEAADRLEEMQSLLMEIQCEEWLPYQSPLDDAIDDLVN